MPTIEERVSALLAQMTLEEKVTLCHAGSKFAVAAIPRLGIPEFSMSDGPHGVRREINRDNWDFVDTEEDYATYLPPAASLAATWNPSLARLFGEVLGAEARARGKDVILGPGINIVRMPTCGRNFEYYGEDPHQIAALVGPQIQGIQSQDVAACVKHYAANSQELNRHGVDVRMDERTLREIYLPGFKAAVEAGVLTVMGAYNLFRGQHCCQNACLLNGILKGEWGFDGAVISDWAGVHDMRAAAENGMDIEMGTPRPFNEFFLAEPFLEALRRGDLPEALVDDKVRRVLRVMFRIGMFDPATRKPGARLTPEHRQAALAIAREAIVLLKNEGALLPLAPAALRKVVVIGGNATVKHALGGNSSAVKTPYEITPLEGICRRLGEGVEIAHFRGYPAKVDAFEPIPGEYLGTADEGAGTHGWKAKFHADREEATPPVFRADADIDFDWTDAGPLAGWVPMQYVAEWKTTLTPPQSGTYEFVFEGANHANFGIDGQDLIQRWENGDGEDIVAKSVALEAGRVYHVRVWVKPNSPKVKIRLGWIPPWVDRNAGQGEEWEDAVAKADAVLFVGGLNHQYDVEGCDRRDMALPDGQNELLERLVALNPRTVAVLVAGSPVEMPWAQKVPAIVFAGYGGMEGGTALAEVLFGDVNPSGKLTMTFPKTLADAPSHALDDYTADVCDYKEGVFTGYRWYDAKGLDVLFPFGYGLGYTTFALSDLVLEKTAEGGARALVSVTNTGGRAGAEVVQIYVGQPGCSVPRPVRELKGFAKVVLEPGETRRVEIELPREAFAFWHPAKNGWTVEPGEFVVEAGVSSRDIRCKTRILFALANLVLAKREVMPATHA